LHDEPEEWTQVAAVSFPMPKESTITNCELEACLWGIGYLLSSLQSEDAAAKNLQNWRPWQPRGVKTLLLADLLQ